VRWRWRGALGRDAAGLRVEAADAGIRRQVILADGAEIPGGRWTGWMRDSTGAKEGTWFWRGAGDTLVSTDLSLAGVTAPVLVFWTRHGGSLFLPDRIGTVECSVDGGASWTALQLVEGSGPEWYPVRAVLPEVSRIRLRFVSHDLSWDVDAIQLIGTPLVADVAIAQGELGISENPVRSSRLFFTWSPAPGQARLSVFTFSGALVYRATVDATAGQAEWDLTNTAGASVDNGAYVAVLEVGGAVLRKRVFVARTP
jgi:hypothetical protein